MCIDIYVYIYTMFLQFYIDLHMYTDLFNYIWPTSSGSCSFKLPWQFFVRRFSVATGGGGYFFDMITSGGGWNNKKYTPSKGSCCLVEFRGWQKQTNLFFDKYRNHRHPVKHLLSRCFPGHIFGVQIPFSGGVWMSREIMDYNKTLYF